MGKLVIYGIIVLIVVLILEFFGIVDIPYLEIPDYTSGKSQTIQKTQDAVDSIN